MSAVNGIPKPILDHAVNEAYEREGYAAAGVKNRGAIRNAMFAIIAATPVTNKKDKVANAVTKSTMLARMFPSMPALGDDEDDAMLVEAVWAELAKLVWVETATHSASPLQQLVAENMGNGYVMCRTKVHNEPVVYITDDLGCIRDDYTSPENAALTKAIQRATGNREMLIERQPHNAKKYAQEYNGHLRQVSLVAKEQLALAVESVTTTPNGEQGE